ncbi:MAG: flagellar hook-length control protein FliK [Pseudomonadota bacterium]
MTTPLLNLPIMNPLTGPSTAPAVQESAGGFEALLAGLFGEAGQQAVDGPFADKEVSDEDAALQPGLADGPTTPPQSAQAQVLAAMLATAPPQNLPTTADAAPSDAPEGEPAGASAPLPAAPFMPPGAQLLPPASAPAALAGSAAPASPLSHKAAAASQATPQAGLAQPETQIPVTSAATDPRVAVPAADQAPELNASAKTPLAAGASPAPTAPTASPASTTSTVITPPTGPAPQTPSQGPSQGPSQAPAPAPVAPPVGVQAAPQAMAQAETRAAETPLEAAPVQPNATPRGAKSAETARRGPPQTTATPGAPSDDATLPTAVAPNANASTPSGAAPYIETDTGAAPRETKTPAAPHAPDFQPPAPAPAAHTAVPTAHATPVVATSETVANLTAQISKKLEGQSTKFDVELNPAGLGRVSVSVEIAASGKMTAAMSFDTPQAAAELRARSHELQRALEQAGFDLSGGLSFDVASDRSDGRGAPQQQQNDDAAWRGRAFQAVLAAGETVEAASSLALNYGRRSTTGVDVRI